VKVKVTQDQAATPDLRVDHLSLNVDTKRIVDHLVIKKERR